MMSTAASFPSVVKPRFIEPVGESQTSEGDASSFATALDNLYGASSRALLCTSSNVKPAHNTTKNFTPTYDEVVNLT
jgi:hypothetical protein